LVEASGVTVFQGISDPDCANRPLLSSANIFMPSPTWRRLELQLVVHAFCLAEASAGRSIAARMAMMAMTTSNSINVKARGRETEFSGFIFIIFHS
jgi:hypothetical protein